MNNIVNATLTKRAAWCVLLVVILLSGAVRYRLIDLPLERDEGEYAYAGQLMLKGVPPYQEVNTMKFPGVMAVYALFFTLFGESRQCIHAALFFVNAVTIVLVFLLAKHLSNSFCAVASAACFALLSVSQPIQGVFANAEHFVIVFSTGGLLALIRGLKTERPAWIFSSGLLFGIAVTMKQHGIAFAAFAVCYIVYDSLKVRPFPWRGLAKKCLALAGGGAAVFVFLCLLLIRAGVFASFWFWTFGYTSDYISQVSAADAWQSFVSPFVQIVGAAPLLWILIVLGLFSLSVKTITRRHRAFLLMFAVFSGLSICPGFYFRPHYFLLLLPCASLLAGNAIAVFSEFLSGSEFRKIRHIVPVLLLAVCLFQSIYEQRGFLFKMTPFEICRSTYGPNPFPEAVKIAEYLRENTEPEDRIAVLGSEPQIFFYAERRSASRYIYMYPMMEKHDLALTMQTDFIKDILSTGPKYLVYVGMPTSWARRPESHDLLFRWIDDYLKSGHMKQICMVELLKDKTIYHWETNDKWRVPPRFWIALFKKDPALQETNKTAVSFSRY